MLSLPATGMMGQPDPEDADLSLIAQPPQYLDENTANNTVFEIPLPESTPDPVQTTFVANDIHPPNETHVPNTQQKRDKSAVQNLLAQLRSSPEMSRQERPQPSVSPLHSPKIISPSANYALPDADRRTNSSDTQNNTETSQEQARQSLALMQGYSNLPASSILENTPALTYRPSPSSEPHPEAQIPTTQIPMRSTVKQESMEHVPLSALEDVIQPTGFAQIVFDDGNYVFDTYAAEFGRDIRAYEEAKERIRRREAGLPAENSGEAQGYGRSLIAGSVISEGGGFLGVDCELAEDQDQGSDGPESQSSVVDPRELQINRPMPDFDYNKAAEEQAEWEAHDEETPAPVTIKHLPDPHIVPLVPIHTQSKTAEETIRDQKKLSRQHIRIYWDFMDQSWKLQVLGRNGCFLIDYPGETGAGGFVWPWKRWKSKKEKEIEAARRAETDQGAIEGPKTGDKPESELGDEAILSGPWPLRHGQVIQVWGVQMKFKLPPNGRNESPSDKSGASSDEEEDGDERISQRSRKSTTPTSNDADESASPVTGGKSRAKPDIKRLQRPAQPVPAPTLGPDGQPLPPKKRGPGRPPKDGVSSTRQKREEARRLKEAAAREANGGVTPPPSSTRAKPNKPQSRPMEISNPPNPGKRKYKKRKRPDEEVVPSIEAADSGADQNDSSGSENEAQKTVKRARREKSPSPVWPPMEELTPEELAEPQDNYTTVLWKILMELAPRELTLRQIYHEVQRRYPCYRYKTSDGWKSSVRHNLNGNGQEPRSFLKGEKDGKGHFWRANPIWTPAKENERRRQPQQQSQADKAKPNPPIARPQMQGPPPAGQWYPNQSNMPPQPGQPPVYWQNGPNGQLQPPQGWYPPPHMQPSAPYNITASSNMNRGNMPPNGYSSPSPHPGQTGAPNQSIPPPNPNAQPMSSVAQPGFPQLSYPSQPSQAGQQHQPSQPPRPQSSQMLPGATGPQQQPSIPPAPGPPNMPTTMEGWEKIKSMQHIMLEDTQQPELVTAVYHSAKRRAMHGAEGSSLPPNIAREHEAFENQLLTGMKNIIAAHPNPNFKGFSRPAIARNEEQEAAVREGDADQSEGFTEDGDQREETIPQESGVAEHPE